MYIHVLISKIYLCITFPVPPLRAVPRGGGWWNLRRAEQETWARVRGIPRDGNTHVCGESLPARQRILR